MNQIVIDFVINFCMAFTTFVIGLLLGITLVIAEAKKKGTITMKSGVLRYIPNSVLGSDLGGVA